MGENNNIFKITKYRLKANDLNTLLIQGVFTGNSDEANALLFLYGNKKLSSYMTLNQGIEIKQKYEHVFPNINREYSFWISLPDDMKYNQYIRVFIKSKVYKPKLLKIIPCSQIVRYRKKMFCDIEKPVLEGENCIIRGWYIDTLKDNPVDIVICNTHGEKINYNIKETYRGDVVASYPEVEDERVKGFELILHTDNCKTLYVILQSGTIKEKYKVYIGNSVIKNKLNNFGMLGYTTVSYMKSFGVKKTIEKIIVKTTNYDKVDYNEWVKRHRLTSREIKAQKAVAFEYMPLISVVVNCRKAPLKYLNILRESLNKQTYDKWEICLSSNLDKNHKINGEYIAFVDSNSMLTPEALYECVKAINKNRNIDILYSDEDMVSEDGKLYYNPHFKSDYNIDLLCSMNYFSHLLMVRTDLIRNTKVSDFSYFGKYSYDLVLKCVDLARDIYHIPRVLYHEIDMSACTNQPGMDEVNAAEQRNADICALQEHYSRNGINAVVQEGAASGLYRTKYILVEKPLVSIIIPNKDHIEDLEKCISSIVEKSNYNNYEFIIVENNSEQEETFNYYKELEKRNKKVRVVYWNSGFNYSALNNYGVKFARGEYLLFLNNDTSIINSECLEELMGYCMRKDVGAVGARLYYPDGAIQHAGVIVGLGGIAGHAFFGDPGDSQGYFYRIVCAQDLSAVTAACMLVKKTVYDEVEGFDEKLKVTFNDVDFCMKIRKAGYLVVYNPYAELYHYESKSRGSEDTKDKVQRFHGELRYFSKKWEKILEEGDPYYNPNLSLDCGGYKLR